jgi:2-haloacid dehalogenase
VNRRSLLHQFALAALASRMGRSTVGNRASIKAVAFDGFAIFDPAPVFGLLRHRFPEKAAELASLWRARQFEYMWLRSLTGRYADFWQVTEDALRFAAASAGVALDSETRTRLMNAWLELRYWPDVPAALHSLRNAGLHLALLSNMTGSMLQAGIRNSDLSGIFDRVLTTDQAGSYKPDPRAYQMGVKAFGLKREHILFAAFAGWDANGAKTFGYPTYWVNRLGQPPEHLGAPPDGIGANLDDLVKFALPSGS